MIDTTTQKEAASVSATFYRDVLKGLSSSPKTLDSKYFYDAVGDGLFQEIMACPEYYPTRCETEILSGQAGQICEAFRRDGSDFDIIELGAGDASKTKYLLEHLSSKGVHFLYQPVDISTSTINYLNHVFPKNIPGLNVKGYQGDYFEKLREAMDTSPERRKIILFLGGNIGNMPATQISEFCGKLRSNIRPGDMVLMGMDLKKDPETILAAYNDGAGITRRFNLNLLERINRELDGNFDLNNFSHFPTYNPITYTCKSYLVSRKNQSVIIGESVIRFEQDEAILMEISQKFAPSDISDLATRHGFQVLKQFTDSKQWFADSLWLAN
ncbi:L-histidine N(alpha)-methyltransferase [Desertivirga xinjiangensis]|uniref:L-histidine N(alpha)-methyltransferase n=1 Tax=Desertivirga xinjiangensis TaxID=539206 RepID=UPI002109FF29|nr:L-histidine N(alpha)-methyltransferase [Pedobacter xinjiangensis]